MGQLRAGIIGLGVGEHHIGGYERHPACKVTKLCDMSSERRAAVQAQYPSIAMVSDAEEILTDPDIDVVSIATYDDVHAAQVIKAINHHKHVFVEKPICLFGEELGDIRAALIANQDIRLSSNLILRMSPRFIDLRRRLQAGELGELYYMEGDYNYGRLHKITEGWRGQIENYSVVHGGMLHLIDLVMWLSGKRILRVSAKGNQIASSGTSFGHNDFVVAIAELEGGALVKLSTNYGCVRPHFHSLSVYGTQATFVNDVPNARLYESREPDVAPRELDTAYPGTYKGDLIPGFLDSILGDGEAVVDMEAVFEGMSVALAVEKSARDNAAIEVRYY